MQVLRKLMLSVTLFSALALPSVTYAQLKTGNDLKNWLDAESRYSNGTDRPTDIIHLSQFHGYLWGYSDTAGWRRHCFPEKNTTGQLIGVVRKYIQEHPEQWSDSGEVILRRAYNEAFPCPDSNL